MIMSNTNTKIEFDNYRDEFKEIYPTLSDEEIKEIFILRVEYWEIVIDHLFTDI